MRNGKQLTITAGIFLLGVSILSGRQAVVPQTPSPGYYAYYANKRNINRTILCDSCRLTVHLNGGGWYKVKKFTLVVCLHDKQAAFYPINSDKIPPDRIAELKETKGKCLFMLTDITTIVNGKEIVANAPNIDCK